MEFPHVNQHSGPLVSLLSNGAKGEEGGLWDILYSEEILIGGREIQINYAC